MSKPPPEEYFRLICNKIKAIDLGPLMAALSKLGVNDVSFDLVTDIKTFNKRATPEVNGADFLIEWIKEHPTFKASEAGRAFEDDGRSKTSVYASLKVLVDRGVLKSLGEGKYSRADVKAIGAPKGKQAKAKPPKTKPPKTNGAHAPAKRAAPGAGQELLIKSLSRGPMNVTQLKEIFASNGMSEKSWSGIQSRAREAGLVKRTDKGLYELTPRGKTENGKQTSEEVTNG
jgi:hypothetical protein